MSLEVDGGAHRRARGAQGARGRFGRARAAAAVERPRHRRRGGGWRTLTSVVEEKVPPGMASRNEAYWQAGGAAGAASGSGNAWAFADAASAVSSNASVNRLDFITGVVS